eukprot:2809327-Pleurochrysis_carterae.AAC.3
MRCGQFGHFLLVALMYACVASSVGAADSSCGAVCHWWLQWGQRCHVPTDGLPIDISLQCGQCTFSLSGIAAKDRKRPNLSYSSRLSRQVEPPAANCGPGSGRCAFTSARRRRS